MGSRAIVVVAGTPMSPPPGSAWTTARTGASTPAPAGRSSRRAADGGVARPGTASAAGFLFDELDDGLAGARLRADALVGEGGGAAARPVRGHRRRGGRRAADGRRRPGARRRARRRRAAPARAVDRAGRQRRAVPRRVRAATAARWRGSRACAWRRSRCSPARARPTPTATTCGIWRSPTGSRRPTSCSRRPSYSSSTWTVPARRDAAMKWWEELTAARRRGHGGEAAATAAAPRTRAAWCSRG